MTKRQKIKQRREEIIRKSLWLNRLLTNREQVLITVVSLGLLIGAGVIFYEHFTQETAAPPQVAPIPASSPHPRINLNLATQEELAALPGIGPHIAEAIIQQRTITPFTCLEDLSRVPGIGPKRMKQIRRYVHIPPQPSAKE